MLAVTFSGLSGRVGTVLCALIVVFSVIGLTMHKDFYAGIPRRGFWCFYTNVSNLLVLVYFALLAPRLYAARRFRVIPHAEFCVMMCIMLTFCVFHFMLFPAIRKTVAHAERTREYFIVCADNFIVHYLVPLLVFAYWLLCSPGKERLRLFDALLWTAVPAVYLAVVLLRAGTGRIIAETGSPYPYPFLDVRALGGRAVARTCLFLYAACAGAGAAIIALIRLFSVLLIK